MEPHEQWRVDQAEADYREFQNRFAFWSVVIGWGLVVVFLLIGVTIIFSGA